MATRINTKFVLILVSTVFAAVVIVGGLWLLQIRGDSGRHIKKGDAYLAEGRAIEASGDDVEAAVVYERAVKAYGRAVSNEPAELSHLAKVTEALHSIRPATQDQAAEFERLRIGVLRRVVTYRPQDADAHLELIRELHRIARWFGQSGMWQEVADAANDMWERVPGREPKRVHALLYRGLAQMQIFRYGGGVFAVGLTAEQDEIDAAMRDLVDFRDAVPGDDLGQATLAGMRLSLARRLSSEGQSSRADEMFAEVDETILQALHAVPDGPEVARVAVLRLALKYADDPESRPADDSLLVAAVDRMVELVASSDNPMLLDDAGRLLRNVDRAGGLARAIHLLETYVDENPEAHFQRILLAQMYFDNKDYPEARAVATAVIEARSVPVSVLAQILHTLRIRAAGLIIDLEYRLWERAEPADKPAQLARVVAARDVLADRVVEQDDDPVLLKADGKIAAARNDHATAAARFERVIQLLPSPDFETLWYDSVALEKIGQIGLARRRIEEAVAIQPNNIVVLGEMARLAFRVGFYGEARIVSDRILKLDEGNQFAMRLLTAIEAKLADSESDVHHPVARAMLAAQNAVKQNDLDGARSILVEALAGAADRLPLLSELIQIELRAGRVDDALGYLEEALLLQPGNTFLRKLRVGLQNEDQIEALKLFMAEEFPDEADRVVHTIIQLRALAQEIDRVAERYERQGDTEKAQRSRGRAEVARSEADELLVRANRIAPKHPDLLDHLFNQALIARDLAAMESLVEAAQEVDADQAGGLIFRGRYELASGEHQKAILTLAAATARKSWSSLAWRLLGRAHERSGHFAEAVEAYEQAYAINPNEAFTIRWYANLLIQTGERQRALRILRRSRHAVPRDPLLREVRLRMEAEVGNVTVALDERRELYAVIPADRANARQLAALLVRATPTIEHVKDDQGNRKYARDQWQLLRDDDRRELLESVAAGWRAESDRILASISTAGDETIELVQLRAQLLSERGEVDDGEQVLKEYRDDHPGDVRAYMALAAYQAGVNHTYSAIATLESARPYQDEAGREADLALADLYFSEARWVNAAELYKDVVSVTRDRAIQLRLVECLAKLLEYDDAAGLLSEIVDEDGLDYVTAMLQASIAEGRAKALLDAGLTESAELMGAEVLAALDQAEQFLPSSPLPHVRRAQRLLRQYQESGRQSLLDDALRALDGADRVQAGAESTSRMRVQVLNAKGDVRGAVGELTRLVQRAPNNVATRRMLMQMLGGTGKIDAAIQVVNEGIELNPTIALWYENLGDLHVARSARFRAAGDMAAADADVGRARNAFRDAHGREPGAQRLAKYAELAMAVQEPEYAAVTELIEASPGTLEGSPLLRGLYAMALGTQRRRSEAIEQMRLAWDEHARIIAQQPAARNGLATWLRSLQVVLDGENPTVYEQLVRELAEGEPGPLSLVWIGRAWMKDRQSDGAAHAIELLETALTLCPERDNELRAMIGFDRGGYQVLLGDYRSAVASFEEVIEIAVQDPNVADHPLALNNAAYIYAEYLDNPARAAEYAARAAAARPGDFSILDTLGWALYKLARYDEAETALCDSVDAADTADNHLHLAWVFYKTGRLGLAGRYLRTAAELRPGPDAQAQIDDLTEKLRRSPGRQAPR